MRDMIRCAANEPVQGKEESSSLFGNLVGEI